MRGEEDAAMPSLIIDTVKPVENCNIINILIENKPKFEEIMAIKDYLATNNGSDPVIFNIKEQEETIKILVNSKFWVSTSNDFINGFKNNFSNCKIEVGEAI